MEKQHGGRKGKRINPLTAQRNASPGPGRMNPTVQRPGSNSSIGKPLLLIYISLVKQFKFKQFSLA